MLKEDDVEFYMEEDVDIIYVRAAWLGGSGKSFCLERDIYRKGSGIWNWIAF